MARFGWVVGYYGVNFFLPFALLLFKTFRPPGERRLFKYPCDFFLFFFLGVYVSDIYKDSIKKEGYWQ